MRAKEVPTLSSSKLKCAVGSLNVSSSLVSIGVSSVLFFPTITHIPQAIVISSYNCSESGQRVPLRDLVVFRKLTGVESTLESRPPSTLVSWQDARSGTADTPPHACMHAMEDKGGRVVFPTGCIKSLDIYKNGRRRWYRKAATRSETFS